MTDKPVFLMVAAALAALALALAGCAKDPGTTQIGLTQETPRSIAADDEALCTYSAALPNNPSYERCRARLAGRQKQIATAQAARIDGIALVPASAPTTDVAKCKAGDANCPPSDVTGSVPKPKP